MNARFFTAVGLSLGIVAPVWAQTKAVMPPPSSFSVIPLTRSEAENREPLWVSAQAGNDSNPGSLSSLEEGSLKRGELLTYGPVEAGVNELEKGAHAYADMAQEFIEETAEKKAKDPNVIKFTDKLKPKVPGSNAAVKTAKNLEKVSKPYDTKISSAKDSIKKAKSTANLMSHLGKFLEMLDVVSIAAESAGYLAEGDTTGAKGALWRGGTKKAAEGAGAVAGSPVPLGSIAGAWAGNEVWEQNIKPVIDEREDAERFEKLKRKTLKKPWLTPQEYMDSKGNVRDLEFDEYVDSNTGNIRRRSPEDQAKFERAEKEAWSKRKDWERIKKDYKAGKISDGVFNMAYQTQDPFDKDDVEAPRAKLPPSVAHQTPGVTNDMLAQIEPVQVTASGSLTSTFGEIKVVETYTFTFWNIGSYSTRYGKASLKVTFSSLFDSHVIEGTFSGGPNGVVRIMTEDGVRTFKLHDGRYLSGEFERNVGKGGKLESVIMTLPVADPSAFMNWPKELQ